jgi:cyclohexyl-isocyanide hydratase
MVRIIRVGAVVFQDMEELDLAGMWEVLGSTRRLFRDGIFKDAYFEIESQGVTQGPIKCYHDLKIMPDKPLGNLAQYDVVLVPGGPGRLVVQKDPRLQAEVKAAYEAGKLVCSVCTGAFILAEAGILKGKRATTFHTVIDKLAEYGIEPVRKKVVVQGNIVTGAGISSAMDVGLKIVELMLGKEASKTVADWVEYCPKE